MWTLLVYYVLEPQHEGIMETNTADTSAGTLKDGVKKEPKQPKTRIRNLDELLSGVGLGQWDALDLSFAPTEVTPTGFLDEREKRALVLLRRYEDEDAAIAQRAIKVAGEHLELHAKDLQGQGKVLPHNCAEFKRKIDDLKEEHEAVAAGRHINRMLTTKLAFEYGLRGSGSFAFFKEGSFIFTPSEPESKSNGSSSDAGDLSGLPPEVAEIVKGVVENLPDGMHLAGPVRVKRVKCSSHGDDLGDALREFLSGRKPD